MKIDPPGLLTSRLLLRSLCVEDIDGPYAKWLTDPEVTRYMEVRYAPPDRDGLLCFVEGMNASQTDLLLGIFTRATETHIGNIRLGPIHRRHQRGTLGILIGDRAIWGQGYATEAIAAVSDFAFDGLGLVKLTAGIYENNFGSLRAFLKAGFHVEIVRRAHAVFDGDRIDVTEMARFRDDAS